MDGILYPNILLSFNSLSLLVSNNLIHLLLFTIQYPSLYETLPKTKPDDLINIISSNFIDIFPPGPCVFKID